MTSANEQQHKQGIQGEPTEVAETLHGTQARTEEHEQPEAVSLDGDTLVSRRDGSDVGDTDNK